MSTNDDRLDGAVYENDRRSHKRAKNNVIDNTGSDDHVMLEVLDLTTTEPKINFFDFEEDIKVIGRAVFSNNPSRNKRVKF